MEKKVDVNSTIKILFFVTHVLACGLPHDPNKK